MRQSPRPLAWGKFSNPDNYYLVTEWIDVDAKAMDLNTALVLPWLKKSPNSTPRPLRFHRDAQDLPSDFPSGHIVVRPLRTTATVIPWAKFFTENRLRSICRIMEENHGTDTDLTALLEQLIEVVIPKLLGNGKARR